MRFSAYSRSIRLPLNDSMIGNIRPLLKLPLWASARISAPVFSSVMAIHFQRSRGLGLPSGGKVVKGSTRLAFAPLSRQMILRWRFYGNDPRARAGPIQDVSQQIGSDPR